MINLLSSQIVEQINETYMVGILATKQEELGAIGHPIDAVTYSSQVNDVIFYIKPLSPQPMELIESQKFRDRTPLYVGQASKSMSNLPMEYKLRNMSVVELNQKIDKINRMLEGKLLLFKPLLTQQEDGFRYGIEDIIVEEPWIEGTFYEAIPKLSETPFELEEKLISSKPISFFQYNNAMPAPRYFMCDFYLYGPVESNQWKQEMALDQYTRILLEPEKIKRITVTKDEMLAHIGSEREHLVFMNEGFLEKELVSRFRMEGISLGQLEKPEASYGLSVPIVHVQPAKQLQMYYHHEDLQEACFIRDLEVNARQHQLVYSREDLINFHTSVKSSTFTILTGQSGTGKTKLATVYGETLGLNQKQKTMLIMSISPAYTEPSDVLGYFNATTGLYMSAETGLVEFLLHAEKFENQLHLLIMDEMNLSQIEHYFAPFLSLLELDGKERTLHLYNKEMTCHNSELYKPSIQLKNNVVIVGTMNEDETTRPLSDRLLDRSNLVVLDRRSFKDIKRELHQTFLLDSLQPQIAEAYGAIYMNWRSHQPCWDAFEDEELVFFDRVDQAISKVDALKGISIRNMIRMGSYLNNLPSSEDAAYSLSRERAIDLFIKQSVMTKLRGPVELYEQLIGTVEVEGIEPNGELYHLFNSENAEQMSDFTQTKQIIARKARELYLNGYAT